MGRVVLVAVAAIVATGAGGGTQTGEVITDSEAYAVYAAALQQRLTQGGSRVERITLLAETRAGDLKCRFSMELPPEWRAVIDNYGQENARSRVIAPGPNFGIPSVILTAGDLTRLMQQAGYDLSKLSGRQAAGSEVFSRLPGGRLVALSAVGFDITKTRAMLAIQFDCFPPRPGGERNEAMCDRGWEFFMEKIGIEWTPAPLESCTWGS